MDWIAEEASSRLKLESLDTGALRAGVSFVYCIYSRSLASVLFLFLFVFRSSFCFSKLAYCGSNTFVESFTRLSMPNCTSTPSVPEILFVP